ncbi:MAG: divisome protein SepX/GlpR [Pseudonocardiaceae bacterium]
MPSSLIFAALATAWLVVLVPMIAKRRQEVVRVAESALASRVLHRPNTYRSALRYDQEVSVMGEQIAERELDERRYRPGRGGYDPEAAALAARERYVFRQRIVLGLLASAIATLLLGLLASSVFLGMHVMLDLALVGYLAYLRRQVRIEEEVRQRRAARMAGSRGRAAPAADESAEEESHHEQPHHEQPRYERVRHEEPPDAEPLPEQPPVRYGGPPPRAHPTAVALDLDDEDPMFDELDPAFEPRYRRAAGE